MHCMRRLRRCGGPARRRLRGQELVVVHRWVRWGRVRRFCRCRRGLGGGRGRGFVVEHDSVHCELRLLGDCDWCCCG
jgi:hypothetical protein